MRILITGATGFVGGAVTARLLAEGHSIVALARDSLSARMRLPAEVEIVVWKTPDAGPHESLPGDFDAVIHLAGESIAGGLWTRSRKQKLWASRIDGTRRLVDALARASQQGGRFPSVFVSASGMGFHGDAGGRIVHEGDAPGNDFLGRMASAWEVEAARAGAFGARVAFLRMGMVLGARGGALPPQKSVFRLGAGAVLGDGRQYWPWIHVEDAAALFCAAIRDRGGASFTGPILAAAGEPVTQREFALALGRAVHRPVLLRIPRFALRLVTGEMADLFLHGQKVVHDSQNPVQGILRFRSLSAALEDAVRSPD
jgi:uncharacterized protein (TIGR01777 family)